MSTQPQPFVSSWIDHPMDAVLHNFKRTQMEQTVEGVDREKMHEHVGMEDHGNLAERCDTKAYHTLRGILKPARVRFEDYPDDVTPPGSGAVNQASRTYDFLPQPPPPPPPPPPASLFSHTQKDPPQGLPPKHGPMPPSLFNTSIDLDKYLSRTAYILYTKFIDELSDFVNQQGEVVRKRLNVQDKRLDLKRQREIVSQSDVMLIDKVRNYISSEDAGQKTEMVALFEAAQEARDCIGPMEAEYEPLEIDLGAEESKLQEKYMGLERRFEHFFRLNVTSTQQSEPSDIEYEVSTAASTAEDDRRQPDIAEDVGLLHGTRVGEEIRVGQVPVLAEGKATSTYNKQEVKRQPFQLLDDDDFLPRHRDSFTGELKEQDVALAGISGTNYPDAATTEDFPPTDNAINLGLIWFGMGTIFEPFEDPLELLKDIQTDPGPQDVDDLLLFEDDMENPQSRSMLSDYLKIFDNTRDRVNRWLLHQVRISPLETYTLRRHVLEELPNIGHWTVISLREWPNDDLGCSQSYHQGSIEYEEDEEITQLQHITSTKRPQGNEVIPNRPVSSLVSNVALVASRSDIDNASPLTSQAWGNQDNPLPERFIS